MYRQCPSCEYLRLEDKFPTPGAECIFCTEDRAKEGDGFLTHKEKRLLYEEKEQATLKRWREKRNIGLTNREVEAQDITYNLRLEVDNLHFILAQVKRFGIHASTYNEELATSNTERVAKIISGK